MKKATLLLFVIITSISAYGQKCKYTKDETDKFSGERVRYVDIRIRGNATIRLKREANRYSFTLYISFSQILSDSVKTQDTMFLKQADGNLIKIQPLKSSSSVSTVASGSQIYHYTNFDIDYASDENLFKVLSSSPLTAVRFVYGTIKYDIDVKGKKGKKGQNGAACLLQ